MAKAEPKPPTLRPRARIVMTLGLELISSETVALTELVKNAFDADARYVLVRLSGERDEEGVVAGDDAELIVLDDGYGMTADTIRDTWLEPATPHRRREKTSPRGRRVLGEKGVGRFAAAKIGAGLELVSHAPRSDEVRLEIDWSVFENEDAYLDEIPMEWDERRPHTFARNGEAATAWGEAIAMFLADDEAAAEQPPRATRGTLLRITDLREPWTSDSVDEVRRALSRLVSPFADDEAVIADFRIVLAVPEGFGVASGLVQPPEELHRPHYTLEAEVDEEGVAHGSYRLKNDETADFDLELVNADDEKPLRCGPFQLKLRVWDRDVESLRLIGGANATASSVRSILDAAAGVSVYRDGFRVLPYGERGDDWLGLDLRRVQSPTRRLSNNQIVGYVLIGRDTNPDLVDQTNREGLVESPAYADLRHAVRQLLGKLEAERYRIRPRREPASRGGLLDRVDLTELRNAIVAALPNDDRIVTMVVDLQRELDDRTAQIGTVLSRYHRLATLGQLIDRVVHEIGQPIVAIRQAAVLGDEVITRGRRRDLDDACADLLDQLSRHFDTVSKQSRVANDVVRRVEPFGGRRRGRPKELAIEAAIADAVALLEPDIKAVGAEVSLPVTSTSVTVDGTELQEVIVNLLNNSLYWLRRVPKSKREIAIDVVRNRDRSLSVIVEDSGPGVNEEYHDSIFEPYFTTREGGVGLGLSIAGEIVSDFYGGELALLPPADLGGARFMATLRRRVGA